MAAGARVAKSAYESTSLLDSGARTATSTGTDAVYLPYAPAFGFVLDVTAAATDVGDTLDVYVQTLIGGNWVDVVHFTQVLGNGGAKRYFSKIVADLATAEFENGTSLSAAAVRNFLGDAYRVRYAITDAGTANASWTFSVTAIPMGA